MQVKIKKLVEHAEIPKYAKVGDAGMDLVAVDVCEDRDHQFIEYGTGIAVQIPEGHVGLIFPRSSVSKTSLSLANAVGVIDSNYTGEIKCRFRSVFDNEHLEYSVGDRIAQLVILPYPTIEFKEVEELDETNRGSGGFGSTGR